MKRVTLATLVFLVVLVSVTAPPPMPHNVRGTITDSLGSGMPNGIPVRIINTVTGQEFNTQVFAPPVQPGAYATTINGSNGDLIIVRAWNATHYGEANKTLAGTTTVNVEMNKTRPSELNVTIILPPNNSSYNITDVFNVTANITNIGGSDGTSCDAQISFGNATVLAVTGGDTNSLGGITRLSTVNTSFEVQGNSLGFSNVTINASCSSDGVNFYNVNIFTLNNITIVDEAPPIINLVFPGNNTVNKTTNFTYFRYNVSDGSNISSCSLIIDGSVDKTDVTITRDIEQNFNQTLANGQYFWSINCTDTEGNVGASFTFNFTLEVFFPNITSLSITPSITLLAGGLQSVDCNFTVEDTNGASDISFSNATFFFSGTSSTDPDDNNVHYSNSSCTLLGSSGNIKNFTCGFDLWYYAVNGTWTCNATAEDQQGLLGSNASNSSVDPLFALNTSISFIDYGELTINTISPEVLMNISNIGNRDINITLRGYGGDDPVAGDGMAMVCAENNISIDNERFSQSSSAYGSKTSLLSTPQEIGYTIPKQTSIIRQNSSYWQIFVPDLDPPLGNGVCNGTIVLQAETS